MKKPVAMADVRPGDATRPEKVDTDRPTKADTLYPNTMATITTRSGVTVIVDSQLDPYHFSMMHSGLSLLRDRGAIELSFRRARGAEEKQLCADPLTAILEVRPNLEAPHCRIAIDLRDRSDMFARPALERCDFYFKRSLHTPDLAALDSVHARKVRPFGLNFACRTRTGTRLMCRSLAPILIRRGWTGLRKLRHFLALPHLGEFERSREEALEPTIVFQTRVWEDHEAANGEAESLNENRVALIRALRREFRDQYRGGLIPTRLALKRYPNEISEFPARRRIYTAMSRKNLIGIYTHGLFQSTAFKLPEYLAASQCIVAEEPRNVLPVPIVVGKHYMPFRSPEECVEHCARLLQDRDRAEAMRRANRQYYASEVAPAARMMSILTGAGCTPR